VSFDLLNPAIDNIIHQFTLTAVFILCINGFNASDGVLKPLLS